jgi:hypothetical protein
LSSGIKFNEYELEEFVKREASDKEELTLRIYLKTGSYVIVPSITVLNKTNEIFLLRVFTESSIKSL